MQLNDESFQSLIDLFKDSGVDIIDMQKEVVGSEKRYEEIFEIAGLDKMKHSLIRV